MRRGHNPKSSKESKAAPSPRTPKDNQPAPRPDVRLESRPTDSIQMQIALVGAVSLHLDALAGQVGVAIADRQALRRSVALGGDRHQVPAWHRPFLATR